MSTAVDEAREAIEQQISGLENQIAQLRSALDQLSANGSTAATPTPRQTRRARRSSSASGGRAKGSRRAARGERETQFIAIVEKNSGTRGPEIASQVHGLTHRLSRAGKITKREGGG